MKKLIIIIPLLLTYFVYGQEENNVHHEVPGSPAFSILDYEPTSILRPSSVAELKTNILNSFDAEGNINPNFGIEFSPYWLKSRPGLTLKEYDSARGIQSIMQTFQISAAVIEDTVLNQKKMGLGFRFQVLSGQPSKAYRDKANVIYKELERGLTIQTEINSPRAGIIRKRITSRDSVISHIEKVLKGAGRSDEFISNFVKFAEANKHNYEDNELSLKKYLEYLQSNYSTSDIAKEFMDLSREKVGMFIEFGFASAFRNISQPNKNAEIEKLGFWVTGAHKNETGGQLIGSIRLLQSSKDSLSSNMDVGLSYVQETGVASISFEGVARWYRVEFPDVNLMGNDITVVEKDFTYRIASNITYSLNDNVNISLSLGKGFNDATIASSGFFSILGVNYNIFKRTNLKPNN